MLADEVAQVGDRRRVDRLGHLQIDAGRIDPVDQRYCVKQWC